MFNTHPDYDNAEIYNTLLSQLASDGWTNSSWHNDTCPSIILEISDVTYKQIFIDYKDITLREDEDYLTFNFVSVVNDQDVIRTDCDTLEEILELIAN